VVAVEIDLVGAHNAHHPFRSFVRCVAHRRSKERPLGRLPRSRSFRVNHLRGFDSLREKTNPSIDLAESSFAILVVGVFTPIAIAGRPRYYLGHGPAFPRQQKTVLPSEPE